MQSQTSASPEPETWLDRILSSVVLQGVTVLDLLVVLGVLMAAWVVSRLVQNAIARAFERRAGADPGTHAVTRRLLHYAIMTLAALVALNAAGVELASLFAAGAVFAVVVGFALQDISQNFVAGVILMVERSITPGDVLEVEGRVVRVVRMGIRSTVARTRDDEDLIVPNSLLVQSTVKNFTLRDTLHRIRATVGVAYASDVEKVRSVLEMAAAALEWREPSKDPRVLLLQFGASAIEFEVSVWTRDPWRARMRKSDLHHAIWRALRVSGITIAFPQLDLHLAPETLRALRGGDGAPEAAVAPDTAGPRAVRER